MTFQLDHKLAEIRRLGHGTWRIEFVIEGYDEQFVQILPGNLSEPFAKVMAKYQLRQQIPVRPKFIHFVSAERET